MNSKRVRLSSFRSCLLCALTITLTFHGLVLYGQHNWTRTNPGGGGAVSMVTGTANGTILSGSDLSGVYYSNDNGQSWKAIGSEQGLTKSHVTCLAPHPTDGNTFFIGTGEGLFKSTNGGTSVYETTIEVVDGLGYVEAIELSASNTNIGYAAHHEWWNTPLTFLKTIDAGENWSILPTTGLPANGSILRLMVHGSSENIVYALLGKGRYNCSDAHLYRSTDGGMTWNRIATSIGDILDFDLHPTDPLTVFASTFISTSCANPIWSYVGGDVSSGAVFKSTNGGSSFSMIGDDTGFLNVDSNANNIAVTNFLFPINWSTTPPSFSNLMGTWKTTNGGTSWAKTGDLSNWIPGWPVLNYAYSSSFYGLSKSVTKDKFNAGNYYASFGGYAWVTSNGGDIFENVATQEVDAGKFLSSGMDNINGNAIDISDVNSNTIYVGYYDLGFWVSRDHGASWKFSIPDHNTYPDHVWGGGGGSNVNFVLNDPAREHVVWATFGASNESTDGAVFKSTAYGENWQLSNSGLALLGNTTHGMSIDLSSPVNMRTLYVTQDGDVYKSIDDGATWSSVLVNGGLKFTAVDYFNASIIYAGGESGFWKSVDAGLSWQETGLPEMRYIQQMAGAIMRDDIVPTFNSPYSSPPIDSWSGIFEIKPDPNNANRVYASAYGPGKGLYRSDNAGVSWTKIYTNDFMRGIAIDPNNSNLIYSSSSSAYHSGGYETNSEGILFSEDAGTTWSSANANMNWPFGGRMEIENNVDPKLWAWNPGTGVQHTPIAYITGNAHVRTTENNIEVFPNPFSSQVIVDGLFTNYIIQVVDSNGSVVLDLTGSTAPLTIDLNTLGSGIYILRVFNTAFNQLELRTIIKM